MAAICLAIGLPLSAQTAASALPSFELATIRPNPGADPSQGQWSLPGTGTFWAKGLSLQFLIQLAYGINAEQVVNAPRGLNANLFDVSAKPEAGIRLTREELRPRLQDLLQRRFHLVAHKETRPVSGYALTVAKGGAKLVATTGSQSPGWRTNVSPGSLKGINWTMTDLAQNIAGLLGRPVADRTGIHGSYDISVEYAPEDQPDPQLPSLFTALAEITGLRLEAGKVPTEVLVIDSVDKEPTPN